LADAVLAAQYGSGRRPEAVEEQLRRLDALVPQLAQGWHRDAKTRRLLLGLLLDEEPRHAEMRRLGRRIGLGEHGDQTRAPGVRDPHLLTVEDVVIAVAARRRADRLHVGAGMRLRHREGSADLRRCQPRQVAAALPVRAV